MTEDDVKLGMSIMVVLKLWICYNLLQGRSILKTHDNITFLFSRYATAKMATSTLSKSKNLSRVTSKNIVTRRGKRIKELFNKKKTFLIYTLCQSGFWSSSVIAPSFVVVVVASRPPILRKTVSVITLLFVSVFLLFIHHHPVLKSCGAG